MESKNESEKHSYQLVVEQLDEFKIIRTKKACTRKVFAKKVAKKMTEQGVEFADAKSYYNLIITAKAVKETKKYRFYIIGNIHNWCPSYQEQIVNYANFVILPGADNAYKIIKDKRIIASDIDFRRLCDNFRLTDADLVQLMAFGKPNLISNILGYRVTMGTVFERSPVVDKTYLRICCGGMTLRYRKDLKYAKLLDGLLTYEDYTQGSTAPVNYWVDNKAIINMYCDYYKKATIGKNVVLV